VILVNMYTDPQLSVSTSHNNLLYITLSTALQSCSLPHIGYLVNLKHGAVDPLDVDRDQVAGSVETGIHFHIDPVSGFTLHGTPPRYPEGICCLTAAVAR
jgi:hypothetical protein